jgi:hypothetical protein
MVHAEIVAGCKSAGHEYLDSDMVSEDIDDSCGRHRYSWGTSKSAGLRILTHTHTPVVPVPVTHVGYPYPCRSLSPSDDSG